MDYILVSIAFDSEFQETRQTKEFNSTSLLLLICVISFQSRSFKFFAGSYCTVTRYFSYCSKNIKFSTRLLLEVFALSLIWSLIQYFFVDVGLIYDVKHASRSKYLFTILYHKWPLRINLFLIQYPSPSLRKLEQQVGHFWIISILSFTTKPARFFEICLFSHDGKAEIQQTCRYPTPGICRHPSSARSWCISEATTNCSYGRYIVREEFIAVAAFGHRVSCKSVYYHKVSHPPAYDESQE